MPESDPPPASTTPPSAPPATERPIPRGCHPLVFGLVLATLQFGATVYFMGWCS